MVYEKDRYTLLGKCSMKIKELSAFTIYRSPKTNKDLKNMIMDYQNKPKAYRSSTLFPIEDKSTSENTRECNDAVKIIARTDFRVRNVEKNRYIDETDE